jgi:hypothetical protein
MHLVFGATGCTDGRNVAFERLFLLASLSQLFYLFIKCLRSLIRDAHLPESLS